MDTWLREWWTQVPWFPQISPHSMSRRGGIGWGMVAWCVYKTECGQETLEEGHKLKWPCLSVGGVPLVLLMCQLALLRGSIHAPTYTDTSRYTYNIPEYVLHENYDPYYPSLPCFVVKFGGIKAPGFIAPWVKYPWILLNFILYLSSPTSYLSK